jgi:hypothetical protein
VIENFVTDFPGDNENLYEKLGDGDCFPTAATREWGWLSNTPWNGLKSSTYEGGPHVMGFLHYYKSQVKGVKEDCLLSVRDISATILEMGGVEYPEEYKGKILTKPFHFSMAGLFDGVHNCQLERFFGLNVQIGPREARGLRLGDWKLAQNLAPIGTEKMRLYNLKEDPFEQNDLSETNPEKYQEMLDFFELYLRTSGQIPKESIDIVSADPDEIIISFSQPVNPDTITENTLVFKMVMPGIGYGILAGDIGIDEDGANIHFRPYKVIPGANYSIKISGATDNDGNPLEYEELSFEIADDTSMTL